MFLLVNSISESSFEWFIIPHHKYQVKPHWSLCFSSTCAAAIVQRNYFFCLYQQHSVLSKVNLLYPLCSTVLKFCLRHLIEQNYLLKTFQRTLILTYVSLYLFSYNQFETTLYFCNLPKWLKRSSRTLIC